LKTIASMSEIIRVGGWALRGAGLPFGVAERATRLLAWTEAVHGGTVPTLYAQETTIARARTSEKIPRTKRSDGGWEIVAERHLIEVGPPLVDLVTSDARLGGVGYSQLRGAKGLLFVSALADQLLRRRLMGLCVYRASKDDKLPASMPPSGWILSGTCAGSPFFATAAADHPIVADIKGAMASTKFSDAIFRDFAESAAAGEGFLAVTALSERSDVFKVLANLLAGLQGNPAIKNYAERIVEAYRNGVPMEAEELRRLYDLEVRAWAPTSERSRSQAGFGKY
jgi:hypothetical protein